MSRVDTKPAFCICENKEQISFAVTAKLIRTFVFATRMVQSLFFLNPKFQVTSYLLWLHSLVCVGPGRKPRRPVFSERGSYSKCLYIYEYIIICFIILKNKHRMANFQTWILLFIYSICYSRSQKRKWAFTRKYKRSGKSLSYSSTHLLRDAEEFARLFCQNSALSGCVS